ncbi:UNVERIFIED_CONTAM: hypothetical protein NCL1_51814 [Trichonephila clavipes]
MNNFLFMRRETRSSRPRKHPFRNKRSKVQRLRRAKEREIKFKALLEQNTAFVQEWLQKVSQGNSAIQDMLFTKTKEVLDPIEQNVNDLNYFSNFFMFDEPVEENVDDSVKKRMNSELNDKSTLRTDSQVHLSHIKKEVDEDATFSNEDCYILHEKIPAIKVETDSQSFCHNEDKILSANSLHKINQENSSPLNKNHEISDSSNMSCTTNSCTEYHSERNENCDDKCQFIKLEFQEVNCDKYTDTFQEEIDLETMYHKTRADIMEDPTSYTVAEILFITFSLNPVNDVMKRLHQDFEKVLVYYGNNYHKIWHITCTYNFKLHFLILRYNLRFLKNSILLDLVHKLI